MDTKRWKLLSAFLILFLICNTATAEEPGTISGRILDSATVQGLEFASVALFKAADNSFVKSTMSGEGGAFVLADVPEGSYKVRITMVGYLAETSEEIILPAGKTKRIGNILLRPDPKTLNEVVITERKSEVEFGADTITYNVGSSILAEGSMATDILKNVPMVDVDIDGKVNIAGKRNTRIFINGKPSDYMASNMADLLSVLPSEAIEKIEVITNPDIRYSADGEGIVNIVLKKGYKIGLNGTLSINAGTRGNYTGSGYLAYRTQTLALSSSYGYRYNTRASNSASYTENFRNEVTSSYRNRFNEGENNTNGHHLRAGLDWDITPKQNFSININGNVNQNSGNSFSDDHRLNSSAEEQELREQLNSSDNSASGVILDADYSFQFNKKKNDKLEIGLISSINSSDLMRTYNRTVTRMNTNAVNPFMQDNANQSDDKGFVFNADYSKPLGKKGSRISAGLQASYKRNMNDQEVNEFDYAAGKDTINPYLTNNYTFFENIYSGYASYSYRTKTRWSFRAGTRAELTNVSLEQAKTGGTSMDPYFNLFPNLGISKTFKKKYITGLNYSVRINRPRDNALNPLINNSDSTNIFYGNPDLKPSVTNQFELNFSTYGPKWSFSPRIGYSNTHDIIERVRIPVDDKGNVETTYRNLASSDIFSVNVFGNYRPTKTVSLNAGFSLSHVSYHSEGTSLNTNRGGISYRGNMALALKLPRKVAFEGNLSYYNNASAQGRNKASLSSGFGARKMFFNNKLVFRVSAADPFNQKSNTESIEGLNYRQQRFSSVNTRNFSLALSYRFTKTGRNTVNKQKKDGNEKKDALINVE